MNPTDDQLRLAQKIIASLANSENEDELIESKDCLIALTIVAGMLLGEAKLPTRQRGLILGLMMMSLVRYATPDEDEEDE